MHPEIRRDSPGECPICGMALESETISADGAEDNAELIDMSRRFWAGAALALPVFFLAMSHLIQIGRMALGCETISAGGGEDKVKLIDMSRRFWAGAALALPVFFLAMSHLI